MKKMKNKLLLAIWGKNLQFMMLSFGLITTSIFAIHGDWQVVPFNILLYSIGFLVGKILVIKFGGINDKRGNMGTWTEI